LQKARPEQPSGRKFLPLDPVPSLSEALSNFSAVIVTGGSSGIGKSFIELIETLVPAFSFATSQGARRS
jgi:hypothetical protein